MNGVIDLTGQTFGRLTVVSLAEVRKIGGAHWRCDCQCGKQVVVCRNNLRNGSCVSCGCFKRERSTKHGRYVVPAHLRKRIEYPSWATMVRRCVDERDTAWERYGGAGVTVCERWFSFENFLADMPPRPSKHYTIDRIDGTKGYEPGNCRWATKKQQGNNRKTNVFIEHEGMRLTVSEWADRLGIGDHVIQNRLKRGWPVDRALTGKMHDKDRVIDFDGQSMPASEWAKKIGVSRDTLLKRFSDGWTTEDALTTPPGKQRKKRGTQ